MRQRHLLLVLLAFVGLAWTACPALDAGSAYAQTSAEASADTSGARPNVLFIAVDDLRPELGVYGASHIHSPNIDRLARSGTLFRRAYVQQAVCSPSRTSLMTGLRPDSTHVYDLVTHFRETVPGVVTLPQHFGRHGYRTAYWGKIYHAGLLDSLSWTDGGDRLEPEHNWRGYVREENQLIAAQNRGRGPAYERVETPDGAYPDGQIASHAVASLRQFAEGDEPFFLAVGFYKPHLPFNAPERYWALYDSGAVALPDVQTPPAGVSELATTNWGELRNYHGIPKEGPVSDSLARTLIHGYYASTSYTDAQVGRVLDELDRLGLAENTIVILWGDHGWKLGDYGDWSKHTNFELDTHAPLMVRAPGMEAEQETDALVEFVDIYPTLVDLAGLPLPEHLQGTSFAPLLEEPGRPWKGAAFSQHPRRFPVYARARTGRLGKPRHGLLGADRPLALHALATGAAGGADRRPRPRALRPRGWSRGDGQHGRTSGVLPPRRLARRRAVSGVGGGAARGRPSGSNASGDGRSWCGGGPVRGGAGAGVRRGRANGRLAREGFRRARWYVEDWPLINQFLGWFTVDPDVRYHVVDVEAGTASVFSGAMLEQGEPVDVTPDAPKRLLVIAADAEG